MVEGVAARVEAAATDMTRSPVARLLAFGAGVREVGGQSYERELIDVFHRPENRVLHDRVSEQALVQLAPVIEAIITDGIEAGQFRAQGPRAASTYVMACFGSLHEVLSDPADLDGTIEELNVFVLRGLGYDGEIPG